MATYTVCVDVQTKYGSIKSYEDAKIYFNNQSIQWQREDKQLYSIKLSDITIQPDGTNGIFIFVEFIGKPSQKMLTLVIDNTKLHFLLPSKEEHENLMSLLQQNPTDKELEIDGEFMCCSMSPVIKEIKLRKMYIKDGYIGWENANDNFKLPLNHVTDIHLNSGGDEWDRYMQNTYKMKSHDHAMCLKTNLADIYIIFPNHELRKKWKSTLKGIYRNKGKRVTDDRKD